MFPLQDDNPTDIKPVVTLVFLASCIAVFFWQLSLGGAQHAAILSLGMIPAVVFNNASLAEGLDIIPAWLSVFTSMFMHGGWMHIISNMLYLWIFGNNVEDAMGHGRFIAFYFVCGIIAALAQALPDTQSTVPMVGASGAISGVLGAYMLLYPRAQVIVWIPLGFIMLTQRVPAAFVLGFWFLMQLVSSVSADSSQGGVAFGAHIGGFIAGVLLVSLFKKPGVGLFAPARESDQ